MSSKDNRDNRSNQLNPNNQAYHSSRLNNSRMDGNDDCSEQRTYHRTYERIMAEQRYTEWVDSLFQPLSEKFTIDAMSLNGLIFHYKFIATIPRRGYSSQFDDCLDIADRFTIRIRNLIQFEVKHPIAYIRVCNEKKNDIFWMSDEYRPVQLGFMASDAECIRVKAQNEMWEKSTKTLVENFKNKLKEEADIIYKDMGEITPDYFRSFHGKSVSYPDD